MVTASFHSGFNRVLNDHFICSEVLIVLLKNKSEQHFHDLQSVATKYKIKIIRIYGIAGHGKNEIDTVGGVAKIALRKSVAKGDFFPLASACVKFLVEKFGE